MQGVTPQIYLKLENLQPIGSFKVRPAANAIACIEDKDRLRKAGVCTASAGNFAQGKSSYIYDSVRMKASKNSSEWYIYLYRFQFFILFSNLSKDLIFLVQGFEIVRLQFV